MQGKGKMKINSQGTVERFRGSGRKIATWAVSRGHNPGTVSQLIHGHMLAYEGLEMVSGRIIADLKVDGLLVTEEDAETDKSA